MTLLATSNYLLKGNDIGTMQSIPKYPQISCRQVDVVVPESGWGNWESN